MSNLLGLAYGDSDEEDMENASNCSEREIQYTEYSSKPDAKATEIAGKSTGKFAFEYTGKATLDRSEQERTRLNDLVRLPDSKVTDARAIAEASNTFTSRDKSPLLPTATHAQSSVPAAPRASSSSEVGDYTDDTRAEGAGEEAESRLRMLLKPETIEGVKIPPEPDGPVNKATQNKIAKWLDLKAAGMRFNARLEQTHAFRNPSIMSKLIEFLELDEIGSNYLKEVYDPHGFPEDAFFDRIAEKQATGIPSVGGSHPSPHLTAAIQKAQQRAIQFVSNINKTMMTSGTTQSASSSASRKRTKWDQPADPPAKRR